MKKNSTGRLWGRILAWMLAAALLVTNLENTAFVHAAGAKANPIEIGSAEDLQKIGSDVNYPMTGDYVLKADIDLSGVVWTPMGGYMGNKGTCNPAEANVFSGTFDGQGHVISGLTIALDGSIDDGKYGQVGFFSVIGSDSETDSAEVKNLIFTDVNIHTDFANTVGNAPLAAVGTLAGEVNGYAEVSNIAVLNGKLDVNNLLGCDTVGAGGIIGECRTNDTTISNNHIFVTDCYNGAAVIASGTRNDLEYAGGIIGRIAKSPCGEVSRCVNTGEVLYCGYDGYGILATENHDPNLAANMTGCYFRAVSEQRVLGNVTALSEAGLTGGTLPEGLNNNWRAEKGAHPVPSFCYDSSAAGWVYLSGISLGFAGKEDITGVKTEIELPQMAGDHELIWTSSDPEVLEIVDNLAVAHRELLGTDTMVTLTVETPKAAGSAEKYSRGFQVTVLAGDENKPSFNPGYATEGEKLSVSIPGATGTLTYQWKVDGQQVAATADYVPKHEDLEKFISVTVTAEDGKHWDLSMYFSELPVVYVNTNDGKPVEDKNIAKPAVIRLQGNKDFSDTDTWYQGETTIKGRGNSTWSESAGMKRPYKLKLDSKANLFGLGSGANKHWVLLSNIIDRTNMRNEVAHSFAKGIGMETTVNDTGVVLILNGEYQGTYELSEHVRVGQARVNVFEWEELADDIAKAVCKQEAALDKSALETYLEENFEWLSGSFTYPKEGGKVYNVADYYKDPIPDFTGGFLLDMDFRSTSDPEKYISTFPTKNGVPMFFRAPEYAKTNQGMVDYAKQFMDAYESAIGSADFTTEYQGKEVHYTDLFDMDSLLQYWLLCEYVNNWDSMKNSTYLYKDLDGKAKMGPAWDYDWAWGNINMYGYTGPFVYDNWHTVLTGQNAGDSMKGNGFAEQNYQKQQWHRYLVKDPYFVTRAWEYYQKYRGTVMGDIMKSGGLIDNLEDKYATASEANDEKWAAAYQSKVKPGWNPGQTFFTGYAFIEGEEEAQPGITTQNFHEAVYSLKTFITKRIEWMDQQFTDVQTLYQSLGNNVSGQISVAVPALGADGTVTATAQVSDANAKSVVFFLNGKKVLSGNSANIAVSDGTASVTLKREDMLGNMLNTIEVLGVDSAGGYITGLMNFTTFEGPEVRLEGAVEVSSGRAGNISYPGDTLTAAVTVTGEIKGNLTYQWYAGETAIAGATKAAYQLTKNEIGKSVSIKVGSTVEVGELEEAYIGSIDNKPTELTGDIKITAEPQRDGNVSYPGDTLKAKVSNDTNTGELTYQWYADGTKIKGATKKSYVLTEAEIGKTLSIKVGSSEQSGTIEKTYQGTVAENPGSTEPVALTGTVSITADPQREGNISYPGDTLTATVGEDTNNTGTLSYQWYAGEEAIAGATSASFELTSAEIGKTLSVKVGSSVQSGVIDATYQGTVAENPGSTEPVALTGTVSITADPQREGNVSYPGDTLTATVGEDTNNTGTLSYQWYAGEEAIAGATSASFELTSAEIGKKVSVRVASSVETGYIQKEYAGNIMEDPGPGSGPGPGPEEPAELTGKATVSSSRSGEISYPGDTLTVAVSQDNNTGTLSYQWYADGVKIAGATNKSYVLTTNEIGKSLTVEVASSVETGKISGTYAGKVERQPEQRPEQKPDQKPIKAASISISANSKKIYAYQTLQLNVTVNPKGASQNVSYKVDKNSVATVSNSGLVTAKAPGKVNVIVAATDGSNVKTTYTITVLKPVIKVSGKTTVKPGKSITLTAKAFGLKGAIKWKLDAKGKKLLKLNKAKGNKVKLIAKKKTGTAKLTISCGKKKVTKKIRVKK